MVETRRFGDRVVLEMADRIANVRLSRPERMNALDDAMFAALAEVIDAIASSDARVAVLSGEGPSFCAGLDRGMFTQMLAGEPIIGIPDDLAERTHGDCNLPQHIVMGWRRLSIPVIAALHGVALGGGLQLALGADVRITAPDARLGFLEIRWGLVPDMGAFALLPNLVRDDLIRELVFSGREVSGDEAVAIGLATRVAADPFKAAMTLAGEIAGHSPAAIRAAKRLAGSMGESEETVLHLESVEQKRLVGGPDQRAVLEKAFGKPAIQPKSEKL